MKKILLLAIMLLNMATAMALHGPLVRNEEGYVLVSNADQFWRAITYDGERIQLAADIEIPNLRQICGTFRGIITGKHKVYDEELGKDVDAMYSIDGGRGNGGEKTWLFDKVEDATFDYICFKNFRVEEDIVNGGKLGLIAKEAVRSKFTNLVFDNISVFEDDDEAGVITGVANSCEFENIVTKFCDVTVDGASVGGLVGRSANSTYTSCIIAVTSAVYGDGKACRSANSGGIVGESANDTFVECINAGLVGGRADRLGGIAGISENSDFISCDNYNAVFFCKESSFKDAVNKIRDKVRSLTPEDIKSSAEQYFLADVITGALAYPISFYAIAYSEFLIESANVAKFWFFVKQSAHIFGRVANIFTLAAVLAVHITIMLTDYDEVGGICGRAEYCRVESCSNSGSLYCDDADCGGIVGRSIGGSINNCLNTGDPYNDKAKSLGSIVGGVTNQTKITNCLSTQDTPIIGSHKIEGIVGKCSVPSDASEESGNNYRLKNESNSNGMRCYELQVDSTTIADGTVAIWLNNGFENRNLAVKPWRQNLSADIKDKYPVLDINRDEVLPKNLTHMSIRDEQDLRDFAEKVNSGDCFCNAVLENDIELTSGEPWTPIGTKDKRWRGVFDGQGYTISGLKCSVADGSEEGAGLFGTIDVHADIRNVILDETCEIEHQSSKHANAYGAGGIVGNVRNNSRGWGTVNIRGCGNYGKVATSHHAGGILGRVISDNNNGRGSHVKVVVDSCFNSGEITAEGNSALICGYMDKYGVVTNCWSDGSLLHRGSAERVFAMNSPSNNPEAEYFAGYGGTITVRDCCDYESSVDWDNLAEGKRCQKGVQRIATFGSSVRSRALTTPICDECAASINDAARDAETSGEAYDIMGHKVDCNHHGVIIVNGKKVLNNH